MPFSGKPVLYDWRDQLPYLKAQFQDWLRKNRWKLSAALVLSLIVWQKDLEFSVNMSREAVSTSSLASTAPVSTSQPDPVRATTLIWSDTDTEVPPAKKKEKKASPPPAPKPAATKRSASEEARYQKRMNYVERFAKVAQGEMRKYGIPASITLAQGLLESSAGGSRLSRQNNNHFGIKCHSRTCGKGHCSNFSDDSHKDFFRIYESAWESYRAHSQVLQRERYQFLYDLSPSDYKGWAHGLKKAGYATDPKYGDKLIRIIESLNLKRYDRI